MERWEAVEAIRHIILAYPFAADKGDFAAVGAIYAGTQVRVFDPKGVLLDTGWPASGQVQDIAKHYAEIVRVYDNGTPLSQHVVTNIDIHIDPSGEAAHAQSYFTVLQATEQLPLQIVIAGRYADKFSRTDDTWRLTHRDEYLNLIGDLSHHVPNESIT